MILDSNINNNDISIPTDNGKIEPTNGSPDSPEQEQEVQYQRQTIIPTAHLDSIVNHNHNETEMDEEGEYLLHW